MNENVQDRTESMLDQALEMTFPASDPFTIYRPEADDAEQLPPIAGAARPPGYR
jgi:hypothetical protein